MQRLATVGMGHPFSREHRVETRMPAIFLLDELLKIQKAT